MKTLTKTLVLFFTMMLAPELINHVFAVPPPPPPAVPIDGGLGFLLFAGIAYGAKKLYDTKQSVEDLN
jgi:hypothetical protein